MRFSFAGVAGIDQTQRCAILGGNAARLLRIAT
jgi:hypothetical protein